MIHELSHMSGRALVVVAFMFITLARATSGQPCDGHWLTTDGLPGTDGDVRVITSWDPDGPGPASSVLVVAGGFGTAGDIVVSNIAMLDPVTYEWSPLGPGLNGTVNALAVLPSGELVAGGAFTMAGDVTVNGIARWNGVSWLPLGVGISGGSPFTRAVHALTVLTDGALIVGGAFITAGGLTTPNIAHWRQATGWSAISNGMDNSVFALTSLPNSMFIAGGSFVQAGTVPANRVALWTGSTWQPLGLGVGSRVNAIVVMPDGSYVVGGQFTSAGGAPANHVARWSNGAWSTLGTGLSGSVETLQIAPDGGLLAGGPQFFLGFPTTVAHWDGSVWTPYGLGGGPMLGVHCLKITVDNRLFAGGGPAFAGYRGIAEWTGNAWTSVGPGMGEPARALVRLGNETLLVGGGFARAGNVLTGPIALWNGVQWRPFDPERRLYGSVIALATSPTGAVAAGGYLGISAAPPFALSYIAYWNGDGWIAPGGGTNNVVTNVAILPNGDIVASGLFTLAGSVPVSRIAHWNHLTDQWDSMSGGIIGTVKDVICDPGGNVYVVGTFSAAGGVPANNIARWNVAKGWSAIGQGVNPGAAALTFLADGRLVVGGTFTTAGPIPANGVAVWDPILDLWTALGPGVSTGVSALAAFANGDIVAGGPSTVAGRSRVSIWHSKAEQWDIAGELSWVDQFPTSIGALEVLSSGELVVAGDFTRVGPLAAGFFARWTETNGPWVAQNPELTTIQEEQDIVLSAYPARGYSNVTVQWQRNGANIHDGPGGASFGGGSVTGATMALASPTDDAPVTLIITAAQCSDTGDYRARFSNDCGDAASEPARVAVRPVCSSNFNCDATVNSTDVSDFINQWFQDQLDGTLITDWDGNGVVNSTDVSSFINTWFEDTAAGCG